LGEGWDHMETDGGPRIKKDAGYILAFHGLPAVVLLAGQVHGG